MPNQRQPLPGLTLKEQERAEEILERIREALKVGDQKVVKSILDDPKQMAEVRKFFGALSTAPDDRLGDSVTCLTAELVTHQRPTTLQPPC